MIARFRIAFALGLSALALQAAEPAAPRAAAVAVSTNAQPRATTGREIWDFADRLELSDEQKTKLTALKAEYEEWQKVRPKNLAEEPVAVRQAYREKFMDFNTRISGVMTEAQKKKFAELRRAATPAARVSTNATASASEDDGSVQVPAQRKPTRPLLSDEEYKKLAAELRAAYSQPATNWPKPTVDKDVKFVELGNLLPVKFPEGNQFTTNKAELGKKLFFDPRLSGSGHIACASCHDPDLGWADGRTVSFGHERRAAKRNAPTILNVAYADLLFWDGRAASLEEQAHDVLNNEDEMHSGFEHVRDRIGKIAEYTNEFAKAYGDPEVTLPRAARAIATFERTIVSRTSPFDAFVRGRTNALDDAAIRGLHLFRTEARCANCHHGPTLSDNQFHNVGLSYYGRKFEDLGRYNVTKKPEDVGAFKTPSLRNLSRTGPLMHNGLFDLDGVLNLYNAGMPTLRRRENQKDDPLFPTKSELLQPLGLNRQDLADLKAFLDSLTETRARVRPPELPAEPKAQPTR